MESVCSPCCVSDERTLWLWIVPHLKVQDDLIAVVIREELPQVGTGITAQGVEPAIGIDINDDRHSGGVSHQ